MTTKDNVKKKKILIVDDEPDVSDVLKKVLILILLTQETYNVMDNKLFPTHIFCTGMAQI